MGETFAGQNQCNPANHLRPFIIEWDATDMSSFQAFTNNDVVLVRYEGCTLTLLDACRNDAVRGSLGSYKPVEWTSGGLEKIDILDEGEVYAKLPLGSATLAGRAAAGEKFHMEYFVSGTRTATRPAIYRSDIAPLPGCSEATHFVYAYNLGAFALGSYKKIQGEVGGTVWGIGAGAKRSSANSAEKRGGELTSCQGETAKEVETCKVPIRLTLREVSTGDNPGVAAASAPETSESLNLAGRMKAESDTIAAANELRQSATTKFQARDGKGCLADYDAADKLDPRPGALSTNPRGALRIRSFCVMLSGKCAAGKTMDRKALQATMPNMLPETIDRTVDSDAGNFCQGGKMTTRERLIKAANDIYKAYSQRQDAKTCLNAYKTIKKDMGKLKEDDAQYHHVRHALAAAPTCLGNAGDCKGAWKLYKAEISPRRESFDAAVKACKGK